MSCRESTKPTNVRQFNYSIPDLGLTPARAAGHYSIALLCIAITFPLTTLPNPSSQAAASVKKEGSTSSSPRFPIINSRYGHDTRKRWKRERWASYLHFYRRHKWRLAQFWLLCLLFHVKPNFCACFFMRSLTSVPRKTLSLI